MAAERAAVAEAGPGKRPRRRRRGPHDVRALPRPVVAGRVLHADERRLRPSELPPELHSRQPLSVATHLPEEVVRREEEEIAAQVAIALDDVVRVRRDVLGVAREDDEVVRRCQPIAARERRDVVVREEVDLLPGPVQPGDEVEVPVPEPVRDAEVEKRARKVDASCRAAHVPAVAPAVAVLVPEVVGLPGVRGEHDGDT